MLHWMKLSFRLFPMCRNHQQISINFLCLAKNPLNEFVSSNLKVEGGHEHPPLLPLLSLLSVITKRVFAYHYSLP